MNKHTPGPWRIGEEHESKVDIINKDGKTIATAKPVGGFWCDKEMKENAKLIAESPEMLEIIRLVYASDYLSPSNYTIGKIESLKRRVGGQW